MAKKYTDTITDVRRVIIIGNAVGVSLPRGWIKKNRLKIGDMVLIKAKKLQENQSF